MFGFSTAYLLNTYIADSFFTLPYVKKTEHVQSKATGLSKEYKGLYNLFYKPLEKKHSKNFIKNIRELEKISLIGVILGEGLKLAVIGIKNKEDKKNFIIVKEGEVVNGYYIKGIKKDHIILKSGENEYKVYITLKELKLSKNEIISSSHEVVKLDKRFIQENTEDIGKLFKDILLVPEIKNGETVGFRFKYIKPKSILYKLGLRSGDLIVSVNDMPIRTAEEAFKIYNMLRNEEYVKVIIERKGKRKVLTYEIR